MSPAPGGGAMSVTVEPETCTMTDSSAAALGPPVATSEERTVTGGGEASPAEATTIVVGEVSSICPL